MKPKKRSDVFDPVVVGTPPVNAFVGLVRLDSGEIRHYNYSGSKPTYISSTDNGFTWTKARKGRPNSGADVKSPVSGEYLRLTSQRDGVYCVRSKGGFGSDWTLNKIWPEQHIMLKPPVFIREGKRVLVGAHNSKHEGCCTFYSDDDGLTWKKSNLAVAPHHKSGGLHKGTRWNHGAVEPTVVELKDGRIWMIMRTAQDNHYESFSTDGGATWSKAVPSRFYGTITMPTIQRLKDGRILFLWSNSTPLPEINNSNGRGEDVFTNRDVLHAAISEDDGKTWIGFRELILNEDRNSSDFASKARHDMSVHQSQFVELPEGKILVSLGQGISRRLLMFAPKWLYEAKRAEDFTSGLDSLTTHQYLKGIKGHCAYNRIPGAELVKDPELAKSVLKICNPMDQRLVIPNQGAVWNFPNSTTGSLTIKIKLPKGSKGGRVSLLDRWVNATDKWSHHYTMFNLDLSKIDAVPDKWHEVRFVWKEVTAEKAECDLYLDDRKLDQRLSLDRTTVNGLSYVHFISSNEVDPYGFLISNLSFLSTGRRRANR